MTWNFKESCFIKGVFTFSDKFAKQVNSTPPVFYQENPKMPYNGLPFTDYSSNVNLKSHLSNKINIFYWENAFPVGQISYGIRKIQWLLSKPLNRLFIFLILVNLLWLQFHYWPQFKILTYKYCSFHRSLLNQA